ncbi:hypothetical protein [Limosilactobacillus vaginalis]|uniref:hypothetical protein n=1 Tax=Limosilactobacillus vaginalis TaxID=1633 RepID=UPI00265E02EE|nr:hypothetical protein [Limosilactobacillus vaginalis]
MLGIVIIFYNLSSKRSLLAGGKGALARRFLPFTFSAVLDVVPFQRIGWLDNDYHQ